MDPFTAIGTASAVLSFVDFGGRLISGSLELYNAADGATSSNNVLTEVSTDLENLCGGLQHHLAHLQDGAVTDLEKGLQPLLKSCQGLAQEFLAVLEALKVRAGHKKWESVRQAFRTIWKSKKLRKYSAQLDHYRLQITTRLLSIILS